jgi:diguanylate cyclase (GGDEF)-like protein
MPGTGRDEIGQLATSANAILSATEAALYEVRAQRNELERLATHDHLTGLATMRVAEDRLHVACTAARRANEKVALLFVDLDGFKEINDRHGHEAGDAALREVAGRLRRSVRAEDTVARVGGDEFVLILAGLQDAWAAGKVAETICGVVAAPIRAADFTATLGASIGIAVFPDHTGDVSRMRHPGGPGDVPGQEGRQGRLRLRRRELGMRAFSFDRLTTRLVVAVGIGLLLFSTVVGVFTYQFSYRRELASPSPCSGNSSSAAGTGGGGGVRGECQDRPGRRGRPHGEPLHPGGGHRIEGRLPVAAVPRRPGCRPPASPIPPFAGGPAGAHRRVAGAAERRPCTARRAHRHLPDGADAGPGPARRAHPGGDAAHHDRRSDCASGQSHGGHPPRQPVRLTADDPHARDEIGLLTASANGLPDA